MTKDVLVSVRGLQFADNDVKESASDEELEKIETICPGQYYLKNGAHYILYEEIVEGYNENIKNMIKVRDKEFILTKKGPISVQMSFNEGKKTMTDYITPFGNILIAIDTKKIEIEEKEDRLHIFIKYGLEANYQFLSDCEIDITVQSKNHISK
ncbi:MAG: DUF1934 domain-containing protein [Lachnospiraceae bacterium]|nr:DUF1934 domain-containing protein [Lachnospiraceae bacterium]MBQ2406808.1 DUF1934 domain-containing protein [Lachnospiraceae bacterium]MBQ5852207.1 DUF1934 domain-containing protein [Lachnospiraceae bacterium]MEE0920294.1 DUF1934 domain-containing protein [Lachnospiraceae bacterium]